MTFTKEQLIARLESHKETAASIAPTVRHLPVAYELALMDIQLAELALAALEAEPVADVVAWSSPNEERTCDVRLRRHDLSPGLLYAAPQPATVVPYALSDNIDSDDHPLLWIYNNGWNACRAAMLQGDEPETTDYKSPFEQWLSQQTGTIDVDCGCVTTEAFYHRMRVAYEAGNSPVTPDCSANILRRWLAFGRAMQGSGSQLPRHLIAETESMLAAAPQQEAE